MGDANYLNGSICLGHDVSLGSYNFFGPFSAMLGGSVMGDANSLGTHGVVLERARIGSGNSIAAGQLCVQGLRRQLLLCGQSGPEPGRKISVLLNKGAMRAE